MDLFFFEIWRIWANFSLRNPLYKLKSHFSGRIFGEISAPETPLPKRKRPRGRKIEKSIQIVSERVNDELFVPVQFATETLYKLLQQKNMASISISHSLHLELTSFEPDPSSGSRPQFPRALTLFALVFHVCVRVRVHRNIVNCTRSLILSSVGINLLAAQISSWD